MKLILPYPPPVNHLYATFRGRRTLSARGKKYKQDVALLARNQGARIQTGEISIEVTVYRPIKRGDLDGYLKSLIDSLTGVCYEDDKQIVEIHAYRRDDKDNPRAEVEIKSV